MQRSQLREGCLVVHGLMDEPVAEPEPLTCRGGHHADKPARDQFVKRGGRVCQPSKHGRLDKLELAAKDRSSSREQLGGPAGRRQVRRDRVSDRAGRGQGAMTFINSAGRNLAEHLGGKERIPASVFTQPSGATSASRAPMASALRN